MSNIQILSNLNLPIGKIINQELFNSKNTQIAVAFLKHSGIKVIENSLKFSLDNGSKFEIIAGLDFKTTDPKSMMFFIELKKKYSNLKFYCYGDKKQNRNDIVFHPKIYLFENDKEKTSIVGSTNLTGGGLTSNFEVNTIFNEKKPVYFSQLQAIYNSIKFTDSLFTPDEDYLNGYSDVFKAFETSEEKALKDKGISKVIKEIELKSEKLPGTIPSIKSMIVDFILEKQKSGIYKVSVAEITENLTERIKTQKLEDNYKLDTFNNSIRGELNHNELNSNTKTGLKLFERVERGYYELTENGNNYKGR
jgi:HKD family nuclease